MDAVLYRKYRSNSFSEVVGQKHITDILRNSVSSTNIAHAYLLCGPRGTGKTTIARILARAVNCENFQKNNDVCNECNSCKEIASNASLDIIEMDAASNRGIEEIRDIKDKINFLPNNLKYKVYIIDEAHMLTKDAFNALLKTLEEPPSHVIFILATTEAHKVPVTILSRVQRYDFRLATNSEMKSKLVRILDNEKFKYQDSALDALYKYSGGSFRDAESLLAKILSSAQDKNITLELVINSLGLISQDILDECASILIEGNLEKVNAFTSKIFDQSIDLQFFLDQLLDTFRDLLVKNVESGKSNSRIFLIVKELVDVKNQMKYFNDKTLLLQIAFLKLCQNPNVPNSSQNIKVMQESIKQPTVKEIKPEVIVEEIFSNESEEENLEPFEPGISYIQVNPADSSVINIVLDCASKVDRGLSLKLESSVIEIKDGVVYIYVKHKHEVSYIGDSERKEKLLDLLKQSIAELSGLQVIMDKDKVNSVNVDAKKESVDNSSVVEGLL